MKDRSIPDDMRFVRIKIIHVIARYEAIPNYACRTIYVGYLLVWDYLVRRNDGLSLRTTSDLPNISYFRNMNFSSKLLENAVAEFSKLPGVGQKTALRLVLHLLNQNKQDV